MSFITPRASGLWNIEEDERMGYFPDDAEAAEGDDDGRTPLDKTIDRIGMGALILLSISRVVLTVFCMLLSRPLPMDSSLAVRFW